MKRIATTSLALVATIALGAIVASSASANLPLKCYEVSEFKAGTQAGNWKNAACTEEVSKLTGQWAEAEPVNAVEKNLWCAKLTPYAGNSETGTWATNKCKLEGGKKSNGEYIEVNVPESTKILPEPTAGAPLADVGTQSEEGHLLAVSGLEVKCKTGSGTESFTSANNGIGEVAFKSCKAALSTTCTQAGKAAGEIVAKGEVHFLLALQMEAGGATSLIAALVYLVSPAVEFTCENASKTIKNVIKVENHSCIAAKDLNLNKLVSEVKEEFTEWTSGETLILQILPENGSSEVNCLPTESENGSTAELFALAAKFTINTYKKSGSALTIELMN